MKPIGWPRPDWKTNARLSPPDLPVVHGLFPERPVETIGGAISAVTAVLRQASSPSPRLDAELLLGYLLDKSRTRLAIDANEPISDEIRSGLAALVTQRLTGQPVAYLIGRREFMGHDFTVGPGVLVPRPETELLVERAKAMIDRHWPAGPVRVLDLCTGSGAIALSLAVLTEPERIHITASDISSEALHYAQINRSNLGLTDRVSLTQGDLLRWTRGPWDLILTNPPYLRPDQIDDNPEIGAEPRLALDGGRNGIETIERILQEARIVAAPRFGMLLELDPDHAESVRAMAVRYFPRASIDIIADLTGRARFLSIENGFQSR